MKLEFEEWYDQNEEELLIHAAESGADRELDFDLDSYFESKYNKYLMEE